MKIGNQDITSIYVGNEQICTIYIGNEQVYNGCSSPTGSFRWKATDVNDVETTRTCADADYYSHEVSSMTRVDLVYYVSGGVNSIKELEIGGCTKKLESSMCANMTGLTSVTMSDSVVDLDGGATFHGCTNLVDVNISSGLTSIPVGMFASATSLSNITIPDNITSIGVEAFERSGIEDITMPSGVTSIGDFAFHNCPNLRTVTMLSATPPTLGDDVFDIDDAGITRDPAVIYVPVGSLSAYTSSQYWSGYTEGGQLSQFAVIRENNPYARQYLTFVALEDGTFTFTGNSMQYSVDNGNTWSTLASNTASPTVTAGNKIMWKQTNPTITTADGIGWFISTGKFNVEGNVMSLYYGDNFMNQTALNNDNVFLGLFYGCSNLISAENLVLPATTLAQRCYRSMFRNCTSLTTAPELPATTLASDCYQYMFGDCTSLTTAPSILPATTLAESCYQYMFQACTSLTTAPELPATTLASSCYQYMFWGCTSLTTAPELPATTLASSCYRYMFAGCTSLTTAPALPATTLVSSCYRQMFQGCTSLSAITCYATDISATNCTNNWVNGVASSGTFTKATSMTSWTSGVNGIPSGWAVVNGGGGVSGEDTGSGGIGGGEDPDAPDPD